MKWEADTRMRLRQEYGEIKDTPIGTVKFSTCLGGGGMVAEVEGSDGETAQYILGPDQLLVGLFELHGIDRGVPEVEARGGVKVYGPPLIP